MPNYITDNINIYPDDSDGKNSNYSDKKIYWTSEMSSLSLADFSILLLDQLLFWNMERAIFLRNKTKLIFFSGLRIKSSIPWNIRENLFGKFHSSKKLFLEKYKKLFQNFFYNFFISGIVPSSYIILYYRGCQILLFSNRASKILCSISCYCIFQISFILSVLKRFFHRMISFNFYVFKTTATCFILICNLYKQRKTLRMNLIS